MAHASDVVEFPEGLFVRKQAHDAVVAENSRLKATLAGIKRLASGHSDARADRRRRAGDRPEEPDSQDHVEDRSDDSNWTLHKISGSGYSNNGADTQLVQVYRIDTGVHRTAETAADSTGTAADAINSAASARYMFRPRDVLQMLQVHEVWQPNMLHMAEDKVDNVINKKIIASIQDQQRVKSMVQRCLTRTDISRDTLKGFRQYTVRLMTFESMVTLYVMLLSQLGSPARKSTGRRARRASDSGSDEEEEQAEEEEEEEQAAAGSREGNVLDEAALRRDVEAAYSWMIDPETAEVAVEEWVIPVM